MDAVVVQWVRTSWSKRSRGGEAAARRNALPVGFPLPPGAPPLAHVVRMRERQDDFAPHEGLVERGEVDVRLREAEGRLGVMPRVQPLYGLPPRRRRPPAVRLEPGQWVRWQLNYRFSSASGVRDWSYWLDTFNIGYGVTGADVFLGRPSVVVDERGPLR
jgi:hypothetical protein